MAREYTIEELKTIAKTLAKEVEVLQEKMSEVNARAYAGRQIIDSAIPLVEIAIDVLASAAEDADDKRKVDEARNLLDNMKSFGEAKAAKTHAALPDEEPTSRILLTG